MVHGQEGINQSRSTCTLLRSGTKAATFMTMNLMTIDNLNSPSEKSPRMWAHGEEQRENVRGWGDKSNGRQVPASRSSLRRYPWRDTRERGRQHTCAVARSLSEATVRSDDIVALNLLSKFYSRECIGFPRGSRDGEGPDPQATDEAQGIITTRTGLCI